MLSYVSAWSNNLKTQPHALDYLLSRGMSLEQIEQFRIGYSTRQLAINKDRKIFPTSYTGDGGFVIFPLQSLSGKYVGFVSRAITEKRYQKNVLDTVEPYFFGLNQEALEAIWETKTVFLVEGAFDYFPLQRAFKNTLCLTSANMSVEQNLFLNRFVSTVYLCLDNDKKGKAAAQYIKGTADLYRCHIVNIPYKDMAVAWEDLGDVALKKLLTGKVRNLS
jgi:DNA primase